jgi:hypothetical protein
MTARLYQMTIAGRGYDERGKREFKPEFHLEASRSGKIRTVRRQLAKRGVEYFQQRIYRLYGIWIPKKDIRIGLELREPAVKTERTIRITAFAMTFKGRRSRALSIQSRVLSYAKKKHKRS